MMKHPHENNRPGAVAPLSAILMVFLLGMVAFAVDVGYAQYARMELEAAADASALAGASRLLDRNLLKGYQVDLAPVRAEITRLAALNRAGDVSSLQVVSGNTNSLDGDIVCGYLNNPSDHSEQIKINGTRYNSIQVRLRRDDRMNGPLPLFFAPVLGVNSLNLTATATATFEDGILGFHSSLMTRNVQILPFALDVDTWDRVTSGQGPDDWSYDPRTLQVTSGPDGIKEVNLFPHKGIAPGNFGTVNIGTTNNSTNVMRDQILNGLSKQHLDNMGGNLTIPPGGTLPLSGNPGISAGFKDALAEIVGQPRIIPIYRPPVTAQGNNAVFQIVAWGGIVITEVKLTGMSKQLTIQPEFVVEPAAVGGGPASSSTFVVKPLRLTR